MNAIRDSSCRALQCAFFPILFYKKGNRLSAFFHPYLCRRIAGEWVIIMKRLSQMIKDNMQPALGVTEPGAIAFAVAKARSYTTGLLKRYSFP